MLTYSVNVFFCDSVEEKIWNIATAILMVCNKSKVEKGLIDKWSLGFIKTSF